jgi:hypothetical protein
MATKVTDAGSRFASRAAAAIARRTSDSRSAASAPAAAATSVKTGSNRD